MMFLIALAAAAGSAGGASQSPQLLDLKCMAAFGSASETAAAEDKSGLETGTMYFAGKLYGRDPRFDFNAASSAAAQALETMDLQAELLRCGAELEALSKAMDAPAK